MFGVKREFKDESLFTASGTSTSRRAEAWLNEQVRRGERERFSIEGHLTPELAELLLARNPDNRSFVQSNLHGIEQDIIEGRFECNGEPIIISSEGTLNDGQHRCRAVINAGRTIDTFFAFGLPRATRSTIDTGIAKTPGHHLAMKGIADPNIVAAVSTFIWQRQKFGEIPQGNGSHNYRPTKAQQQDVAERYLDKIAESIKAVPRKGSNRIASRSQLAFIHMLLAAVDRQGAAEFIKTLVSGAKLEPNDPLFVARERFLEEKRRRTTDPHKSVEIALRAWAFHRRGKTTTKIQLMGSWPEIAR